MPRRLCVMLTSRILRNFRILDQASLGAEDSTNGHSLGLTSQCPAELKTSKGIGAATTVCMRSVAQKRIAIIVRIAL